MQIIPIFDVDLLSTSTNATDLRLELSKVKIHKSTKILQYSHRSWLRYLYRKSSIWPVLCHRRGAILIFTHHIFRVEIKFAEFCPINTHAHYS